MSNKKLTCLAVATMLGAALITAPVQARGAVHGGAVGRLGGGGFREAATGPGFAGRTGFVGSPGFAAGAGWWGSRRLGLLLGFGLGLGTLNAAADSSCWTWVQTPFGWQHVWAVSHCGLGYGGDFYGQYW
jgi:hypothetical protein